MGRLFKIDKKTDSRLANTVRDAPRWPAICDTHQGPPVKKLRWAFKVYLVVCCVCLWILETKDLNAETVAGSRQEPLVNSNSTFTGRCIDALNMDIYFLDC
jgi:hypothetical protein